MKAVPGKVLLILFVIGFGIFFGLDTASRGIGRIQGPVPAPGSTAQTSPANGTGPLSPAARPTPAPTPQVKAVQGKAQPQQQQQPVMTVEESFVNHLSNKIGDALRRGAILVIGFLVSIFDAIVR